MPSFMNASNGLPVSSDWPTMWCSQPTSLPSASSPAFTACT